MHQEKTILVVDIETTGFLEHGGKIVEIGIVKLNIITGETTSAYNSLVKEEGFNIDHTKGEFGWVFRNSDLNYKDVKNAPDLESQRPIIQGLFNKYKATAYNKKFDFEFLKNRDFKIKELSCPMIIAAPLLNIPSAFNSGIPKWPSVQESWDFFFKNSDYKEKHRGLDDATHEAMIVFKLIEINKFPITMHDHFGNVKLCKTYEFDFWHRGEGFIDERNHKKRMKMFNEKGQLTAIYEGENPNLFKSFYRYDDSGNCQEEFLTNSCNKLIEKTKFVYDEYNNVVEYFTTDKENKITGKESYNYVYKNGLMVEKLESGPLGNFCETFFYYDSKCNLTKLERDTFSYIIDYVCTYKYDRNDNLIEETEESGVKSKTKFRYDQYDNKIEDIEIDDKNEIKKRTIFKYDKYGNIVSEQSNELNNGETFLKENIYSFIDTHGNWEEKLVKINGQKHKQVIREFKYYEV